MDKQGFEKTTKYLGDKYGVEQSPKTYSILDSSGQPYIEPEVSYAKDDDFRSDGWGKVIAGGNRLKRAKDLSSGSRWSRLDFAECENFYSTNALAKKVVQMPIEYGLLNGWKFSFDGQDKDKTLKKEKEIHEQIDKPLGIVNETLDAIEWGRLYGSAYLLGNFEDGRHPSEPLDINNIKKINWIRAITPFELYPLKLRYNISSNYLEPERYIFSAYGGVIPSYSGLEIHTSRIIRFNGSKLPRQLYVGNQYVHNSVLQPVYDVFNDYGLALEACGYAISEFSQGVYKFKGLASMLQQGKEGKIISRMQAVDAVRNLHRTIIMDADKEDYQRVAGRFAGIGEIVSKLEKQMVAVSGIPHNLLFSEAAGNGKAMFSSKGDSEWGEWETTVHSFRKKYLTDGLTRLYTWLFLNKDNPITRGKPEKFKIMFSGQRKLAEDQEVELYKSVTETDISSIDAGIVTSEEIRKTRYAQGGTFSDYSIRVELDEAAYKKAILEKQKNQEIMEKNQENNENEEESGENEGKQPQNGQNNKKEAPNMNKEKKPQNKENTIKKDGITFIEKE